jgi:hypothetical protein
MQETQSFPETRRTPHEEPFYRQLEIVHLARRLGVEDEEEVQFVQEDYGHDIESIVAACDDDDDDSEEIEAVGEEGYYLDGVYYVYPKAV